MKKTEPFVFNRGRGIVWVCDLSQSSMYLNDDEFADDIEEFIPRFYFTSKLLVESYGGEFIKWTGDGFLAWFGFELDRYKKQIAPKVFEAAFQLTILCDVTQFGIKSKKKFRIRHGITYEQDALLMSLKEGSNNTSDIIGRSVVLAFRLSGIMMPSPSIITVKELVDYSRSPMKKWAPTAEQKLKYFKGERFGINSLYVSFEREYKNESLNKLIKNTDNLINDIEANKYKVTSNHAEEFIDRMTRGPIWTQQVLTEFLNYIKNDLFPGLKMILEAVKQQTQINSK